MFLFKRKSLSYRSVLFVCTANVTRSASAEGMFRDLADRNSAERWDVASAGVKAHKGSGPNPPIKVRLMECYKIFIDNHRSQPITSKLFKRYYWIIVMERAHKEAIIKQYPDVKDRVHVLREFGQSVPPSEPDMPDPTGEDKTEGYRELLAIFEEEIPRIFQVLQYRVDDLKGQENG
ncbi:MAG: hypothetical protein P9M15_05960 [Candidatus Electryoneaceae bacterium]|nr:hypothetical protein [Candidatus Electryoneaceae bacterium]